MTDFSGDVYIDTAAAGGGDGSSGDPFDSLEEFMAASPNLTGALTVHCTGGQDTITSEITLSDITGQSATNDLTIQGDQTFTDPGNFAEGYYLYRTDTAAFTLFRNPNAYTRFNNFRAKAVNTAGGIAEIVTLNVGSATSDISGDRCWFQSDTSSTSNIVVNLKKAGTTSGHDWDNCILQCLNAGYQFSTEYNSTTYNLYKCAFVGGTSGVTSNGSPSGTKTIKGCWSADHSGNDFNNSGNYAISYCATDDTAYTGTGNVQLDATRANDFADFGNDDFEPVSSGTLEDAGTTIGAAIDILDRARSGSYDIGPLELQAAASQVAVPLVQADYILD